MSGGREGVGEGSWSGAEGWNTHYEGVPMSVCVGGAGLRGKGRDEGAGAGWMRVGVGLNAGPVRPAGWQGGGEGRGGQGRRVPGMPGWWTRMLVWGA